MNRRHALLIGGIAVIGFASMAYGLDKTPAGYGITVNYQAIIGPPPAPGSASAAADRAAIAKTTAGIDGPAWKAAESQLHPSSDTVRDQIACALGRRIAVEATPATARLMYRAATELQVPIFDGKSFYHRDRPYVGNADTRTCDPRSLEPGSAETGGALSYSYPSGHAAYGELMAKVLGAAVPTRAAPLTAWGRQLGDNRVVCRVHWPSDVAAGRRLADAMFAQLAAKPAFQADVAAARAELAKAPAAANCRSGS
jgi:acid phosphatase (class A)